MFQKLTEDRGEGSLIDGIQVAQLAELGIVGEDGFMRRFEGEGVHGGRGIFSWHLKYTSLLRGVKNIFTKLIGEDVGKTPVKIRYGPAAIHVAGGRKYYFFPHTTFEFPLRMVGYETVALPLQKAFSALIYRVYLIVCGFVVCVAPISFK